MRGVGGGAVISFISKIMMHRPATEFNFFFFCLLLSHSFGDQLLRVVVFRPSWYLHFVLEEQADESCYFRWGNINRDLAVKYKNRFCNKMLSYAYFKY